jgi:hypothetical protein
LRKAVRVNFMLLNETPIITFKEIDMTNPIKTAAAFAVTAVYLVADYPEHRTYKKERAARKVAREQHDAMIAESQAKIGPYMPQPCPVQIWA